MVVRGKEKGEGRGEGGGGKGGVAVKGGNRIRSEERKPLPIP